MSEETALQTLEPIPAHLAELPAQRALFVANYVRNGGKAKKAAIDAGYAAGSAHVTASRILSDDKVLAAIQVELRQALTAIAPKAMGTMQKLALRAKSEHVRFEASQDILNRAGVTAPKRIDIGVGVSVTIDFG